MYDLLVVETFEPEGTDGVVALVAAAESEPVFADGDMVTVIDAGTGDTLATATLHPETFQYSLE
jgi:hypothetical protein